MKKSNKILLAIIAVLLVITLAAVFWYLSSREKTPENGLILSVNGKEQVKDISKLQLTDFSFEIVNGKGEKKNIEGAGIKLSDFIETTEYSEISVIADDSYSALIPKEDIDGAWLQIEDTNARLFVVGDKDSKRNVKNVVRIEVR